MRLFISLALATVTTGALTALAAGGTGEGTQPAARSSVAAIADASSSWAEFSSKVPNLANLLAPTVVAAPE